MRRLERIKQGGHATARINRTHVLLICLSGLTLVGVDFAGVSPVGGMDYPRTYQEFRAWFPDDA
ncbi:hypothetical protein, partial [Mycobacterium nebraskense]|uniref:hypothetical protein n=1 Tax=Mycobacterium nebraskense TaxID=244292 RepID=UPI001E59B684